MLAAARWSTWSPPAPPSAPSGEWKHWVLPEHQSVPWFNSSLWFLLDSSGTTSWTGASSQTGALRSGDPSGSDEDVFITEETFDWLTRLSSALTTRFNPEALNPHHMICSVSFTRSPTSCSRVTSFTQWVPQHWFTWVCSCDMYEPAGSGSGSLFPVFILYSFTLCFTSAV